MVEVGFIAKTYDVEVEETKTDVQSWTLEELTKDGFLIKITFNSPDLIGYSLYESDQVLLAIDLSDLSDSTSELYGRYIKEVPL